MNNIEIYKETIETMWKDSETFLCVFDNKNNLIADYDFCTGLKLMQDEKDITIFIKDEDLIAGKWVFFGTKVNKDFLSEKIKINGRKKGSPKTIEYSEQHPWSNNCGPGNHTSRQERQKRVSVCVSCPLFDSKNMTCTVDETLILESTKYEDKFCPEGKWGEKELVMAKMLEDALDRGDIIIPKSEKIIPEEQENFEEELDRFLKGM